MKTIKKFPWRGITLLIISVVTSSWVADGLKGEPLFTKWHPGLKEWQLLITLITFVVFILSVLGLYHYRKEFLALRTLEQVQTRPHAGLILLLSKPSLIPEFPSPSKISLKKIKTKEVIATFQISSLEEDIEKLNKIKDNWNWQQILRALLPHKNKLKYVYLIGSSGDEGSYKYFKEVEELIKQYIQDITVEKAKEAVDFENLEDLIKTIHKAVRELKEKYGLEDRDIIIDVTGGKKTTSIAGAVVTLNSDVTFQYVQTEEPYGVMSYNVDIQSPISL